MYATYRRQYENFTHLPGESVDALFQRFKVVVNNMRPNVDVLSYDDNDRVVKLVHSLDRTIWGGKFEAIVDSEKYDTLTVNKLFSKLKSAEVDRGMTAKLECPTDSHNLALVGGSKGKTNTNPSTRMFSLSSLMSMPDEEFDVLGEDELALLTRRFERLHENWVNMRRNMKTSFQCGKPGHFISDCPEKVENKDSYKHKSRSDGKYRSRRDHKSKHKNKHKDERRSRRKESRGKARALVGKMFWIVLTRLLSKWLGTGFTLLVLTPVLCRLFAHMLVFEFPVGDLKNIWLIDSGCSRHMTRGKGWFPSLVPVVTKRYTTFGDNG
jgi:hypothetical protein